MQISGGPSLNEIFAGSYFASAAQSARVADADIRTQALRAAEKAGPQSTVSISYNFAVGPDGQLYATSATINTSERRTAAARSDNPADLAAQPNLNQSVAQLQYFLRRGSFSDLQGPQVRLSPSDQLALFANQQPEAPSVRFRQEAFGSVDNLNVSRLRIGDFGVRAQEAQHFRAAGGLASGVPLYDFEQGPDGSLYAVAGSVTINPGPAATEEEAAQDAATVARAALAATDVSAQDISVARDAQFRAASLYQRNSDLFFYPSEPEYNEAA